MTDTVADDLIRSYFERWERLEEEKKTISDDLKELFAEARGNGLDTKALRAVFREQVGDQTALNEFDAICDLYRTSLNRPRASRACARENIDEFRASPGVATEAIGNDLREPVAVEQGRIIREGDAPRETDCQDGEASQGGNDASCPDTEFQSAVTPLPAEMPETEPQVPQSVSGSPISDDEVPTFLLIKARNRCDVVGAE